MFPFLLPKIGLFYLVVCFGICSPHSHKSKTGSKENVDHGSFVYRDSDHYKNGKHNYEFDHESVLGSHNAAEEFDNLPPKEAKKRLHSLALKMDNNGDNFVDRKELINWILRSFKLLTEEEALNELEDEDGDNDGKITWEEHLAETYGMYDDDVIIDEDSEEKREMEMFRNDKELFEAADINADGILDKTEYPAFSHPEEFEHMHQVLYKQAMRRRDLNRDGFLSLAEFLVDHHGMPISTNTEQYSIEKERFKLDLDLDGDNKLNREEVLLWIVPNNVETAENEADHLIESSDTDKDGKLSIEEIVSHHEIFVGSEATDFGEQLHDNHRYNDEL